jgi:hypothetical protein
MNREATAQRSLNLPKTFILLLVALAAFIGASVWRTVSDDRARAAARPFFALDAWIKDLLAHRSRFGDYPTDLADLDKTWRAANRSPRIESGGWVRMRNCDHWYHKIQHSKATLWVVPTGPNRTEGKTFFCIFDEARVRVWKGPPLTAAEADVVARPAPSFAQLAALGLIEQKPVPLTSNR